MEKNSRHQNRVENEEDMKIIKAYERGEFVPMRNRKKVKSALRQVAKRYLKERGLSAQRLKKDMRVNIRMATADLNAIKRIASDEGLPYQTLIASILYKFANGRLVTKEMPKRN